MEKQNGNTPNNLHRSVNSRKQGDDPITDAEIFLQQLEQRSAAEAKRNRMAYQKKKQAERLRQKRQKRILAGTLAVVVILFIVGVFIFIKSISGNSVPKELVGTWSMNQATEYIFEKNGTGTLHSGTSSYQFTFTVKDDVLSMDYDTDALKDCSYTFTVQEKTLTLVGGEGTIGGTYTLTKE